MRSKPDSKAGRTRAADKLIRGLLRAPRTRPGLIAVVTVSAKVSRNFVYGWLAKHTLDGTVTVLKGADRQDLYQITTHVVVETARAGDFPSWLEPRCLPVASARHVFIAGNQTTTKIKD